ncbi:phospholipase C, phosphocholine-specific [Paraburkholderia sp. Ac-20340]|uniref:phosphocholine-specific phospholipase C n=1 Tax=Paraburkholderia sp. Ac-20340 TaxID=2703888 RepID=UPI0019812DD1|nr:phospholipase C, phosphocholine-specific [Paraburkholderia sp. Ac-20340]MBN3853556.1 phospholipase C, phosphocholine-specific [Paraburkholderia sp. Ac-20340]
MTSKDRRQFLRAAATGAALGLFPPAIRRALAIPANNATGTIQDVQHVVILMQENRSFDQYFGTLPGVRGFGDRITIPQPQGASIWQQSDGSRSMLSFHLDKSKGNALLAGGAHEWLDAHSAWDHGRMTQWPKSKGDVSMGYLEAADLPFHFALANAFTICDAYHCSLHGGTNSNRIFLWTGTNGPGHGGFEPHAVVNNNGWDWLGSSAKGLKWTTYPERLQKTGVSWKVYENQPDNYNDNPLCGFASFRKVNESINGSPNVPWTPEIETASPLYKGIGNTMPDGGLLQALKDDIAADRLPQISWIIAPQAYCEHPNVSTPDQGAWYIQQVLDALTAQPEVWSKTVLFVNHDENDCFFDHVPPPVAPSPIADGAYAGKSTVSTKHEYFTVPNPPGDEKPLTPDGLPYGPGPRVPMLVISPWSTGGFVNSQAFDHTSVLRFLERRFGVTEPNISAWRRAVFGDLTSAFNFSTPNEKRNASFPALNKAAADALNAQQSKLRPVPPPAVADQSMPRQARLARPSRALPYQLHVHAGVDGRRREVRLVFVNEGSAGAVFHVYDQLHLERMPRRYTVEAGKQLADEWTPESADDGRFDLWVLGPNGFHRGFIGNVNNPSRGANAEARLRYDAANNTLTLTIENSGSEPATCSVKPNAYTSIATYTATVPAHERVEQSWRLAASGGWYDFTLSAHDGLARRFAGRLETGKDSISDPEMGSV